MSYSTIAKNASIYTVFSIFSKAVNFLLLPLYTAYLTTEDYGIVGIITALTAFLSTIYVLSLNGAINRFYIEYKDSDHLLNALYSTIFITIIINVCVWTIIVFVGHNIFDYLLPGVNFYPFIFWGLMTVSLKPIYLIYQRILQAQQNGKKVAILDFSLTAINITLTILFVVFLKEKAIGVIKAQTFAALVIAIAIIVIFLRKLQWTFNREIFNKTMKYSLPLIPHSMAGVTSTMIDRFVINKYLGAAEVGIYNIAFQFGNISNIITSAFNQAYVPWFNQQVKDNKTKSVKEIVYVATIIFSLLAMGISLFADEILRLFAKGDFLKGTEYIPYLAFAYVLNGIYFIFATELFYDISGKGSQKLAFITISSAGLNFILNILFVPKWGIMGSAFAFIITKLFFAATTAKIVKNKATVKINPVVLILISLFFFIISLIILQANSFIFKAGIYLFLCIASSIVVYIRFKDFVSPKH